MSIVEGYCLKTLSTGTELHWNVISYRFKRGWIKIWGDGGSLDYKLKNKINLQTKTKYRVYQDLSNNHPIFYKISMQ